MFEISYFHACFVVLTAAAAQQFGSAVGARPAACHRVGGEEGSEGAELGGSTDLKFAPEAGNLCGPVFTS